MNTPIDENLAGVRRRIAQSAQSNGRAGESVHLLAVTKMVDAEGIRCAFNLGQACFGENYLQEALIKMATLRDLPIEWHFIGRLQSNKTRAVAESFAWVHGVERIKIAERLAMQRPNHLPPLNVCLQYNVSGETSKAGVDSDALVTLADAVAALPSLRLRGLMALPAPHAAFAEQCAALRPVRLALEKLRAKGHVLDTLSMGTSDDLEAAIAEGATMVRVGSAIFGART